MRTLCFLTALIALELCVAVGAWLVIQNPLPRGKGRQMTSTIAEKRTLSQHIIALGLKPGESLTFRCDFDTVSGLSVMAESATGWKQELGSGGEAALMRDTRDKTFEDAVEALRTVRAAEARQ